ncbi:DnaB-like helicase C-terminal domain-containing protein [Streptomyces xiamenensis]|uniref:DnaB-like helicase C-terminal domain-containing protein n=1 Tax=Streptomyces xiamenensis TaxID=408015 RepID=UPI0036E984C7
MRARRRLVRFGEALTTVLTPTPSTPTDPVPGTPADTGTPAVGLPTGIRTLDEILGGLQPGRFYLAAAAPGTGASLLPIAAARTTALEHGLPVLYAASGLTRGDVTARILASHLPVDYRRLRAGRLTATEQGDVTALQAELAAAPLYIDDGTDLTPQAIAETAAELAAGHLTPDSAETAGTAAAGKAGPEGAGAATTGPSGAPQAPGVSGLALVVVDRLQTADDPRLPLSGPRLTDAVQALAHLARTHHVPVLAVVDTDQPGLIASLGLDTTLTLHPHQPTHRHPADPTSQVLLTVAERDLGPQHTLTLTTDPAHARLTDYTPFDPYANIPARHPTPATSAGTGSATPNSAGTASPGQPGPGAAPRPATTTPETATTGPALEGHTAPGAASASGPAAVWPPVPALGAAPGPATASGPVVVWQSVPGPDSGSMPAAAPQPGTAWPPVPAPGQPADSGSAPVAAPHPSVAWPPGSADAAGLVGPGQPGPAAVWPPVAVPGAAPTAGQPASAAGPAAAWPPVPAPGPAASAAAPVPGHPADSGSEAEAVPGVVTPDQPPAHPQPPQRPSRPSQAPQRPPRPSAARTAAPRPARPGRSGGGEYAGRDYGYFLDMINSAVEKALEEHGGDTDAAITDLENKAIPNGMALFEATRVGGNYEHTVYPERLEFLSKKSQTGADDVWEGRHKWENGPLMDRLKDGTEGRVDVDVLDTNAAFCSALKTWLPIGALQHQPDGGFDPKRSGIYLLPKRPAWEHAHLPDPIGNRREPGPVLLDDATIRLLIRCHQLGLADAPHITQAWTSGATENLAEKFRRILTAAREKAITENDDITEKYVKAIYSKFVSTIGESTFNRDLRRPDWTHIIRSQAFANLWRKAHRAHTHGLTIVRLRGTDELHITGNTPWRTVFTEGRLATQMKLKNQYTLPAKAA